MDLEDQNVYDPDGTLEHTPTWAVGIVCIVLVAVSITLERALRILSQYLQRTNQKPLQETLHRMREDLMMLGFLSLFLTASTNSLTRICIPERLSNFMLPCSADAAHQRGILATPEHPGHESCVEGKVPLMSVESIHQLHIFIFVMAIVHVFYSCLTMVLASLQIKGWGKWEEELWQQDAIRESFKVSRQNSFVTDRARHPWKSKAWFQWIDSFFRQFYRPVKRSDYLTLRLGFVKNHNVGPKFNFLKYMMQTMEEDFKVIVGISAPLWAFVIVFMLLNIYGWYTYFWIAFVPLLLLLIVGTKLQHVMTILALEIGSNNSLIGVSIKPRDELFWFNRPHLMLHLIHFILFQNSFELAYFFWLWATYGIDSCFMERRAFVYIRVILGFFSQVLCSYTTLPLYALVTQMGSSYKKAIFGPPIEKALHGWHHKAMENRKKRISGENADAAVIKERGALPKSPLGMCPEGNGHKAFDYVKSRFSNQSDRDMEESFPQDGFHSQPPRPSEQSMDGITTGPPDQSPEISIEILVEQHIRLLPSDPLKLGHKSI